MSKLENHEVKSIDAYPPILLVEDVMELLQISKPLAYKILKEGMLKNCKIGREYKIVKSHFIEFLNTKFKGGEYDR